MTTSPKNLFKNRSAANDFLFSKTEAAAPPEPAAEQPPLLPEELTRAFPDVLAGEAFIDRALETLEAVDNFQALLVRMDPPDETETEPEINPKAALQVQTAQVINRLCANLPWQWGKVDRNLFGCFLPLANGSGKQNPGTALQTALGKLQPATFSIGCALFPQLDYEKADTLENARKALDHAAFFGPGAYVEFDAVSLNISGDQFYQKGDINQAMAEFKRALELDPENVNVHNSLGVCYGVLGAYEKAAKIFQQAAHLAPGELMPAYNTGLADLMIGDKESALKSFLLAVEKDPRAFEPAFQAGHVLLESAKPKKARPYLEKAIQLNPDSAVAHRHLGQCYLDLKRNADAIGAFKKAVQLFPNDAPALSALGYLYDLKGENPEITTVFGQQSVEIAPENGLFRYRLGQLLVKKGELEKALKEFETAKQLGHDTGKMIETVKERITIEIQ